MRVVSALMALVLSLSQADAAPETSLKPVARGTTPVAEVSQPRRPVPRPVLLETALANKLAAEIRRDDDPADRGGPTEIAEAQPRAFAALSPQATGLSLRPFERPARIVRQALAQERERARGAVCGDPAIQGEIVGHVPGEVTGCGVEKGVRVRSISGIPLSQAAVLDCPTAKALKAWVDKGMRPAVDNYRGGVKQIRVAAHYACRTRNNQSGERISEHGKGRAIDISGFRMHDGTEITLLDGWEHRTSGAVLRDMHRRACGIFGTVLGPESNRFHRDHFHFDTARYRSGSFCR